MTLSIDTMYAFIAVDDEGEGICGFANPRTGMWMPMVGADLERIAELRPMAQEVANRSGKRLVLAHFTSRVDQEVIEPRGFPDATH